MDKASKFKHICFDLDGTLIDSYQNIFNATIKTLKQLKIEESLYEPDFQKRIGHHFLDIFSELNIPVIDIEEFINIFKGFYFDFIDDSKIYNGVENVLNSLNDHKIKISLLTTKSQDQADKIIDYFSLRKYFSLVMGRRNGIPIKPSAEPLLIICKELNVDPTDTLIVGDSELDINCGKNAGVQTCAVSYGYRSEEKLLKEKPDFIVNRIEELNKIIFNSKI
ncbi:MAG: HAD family hydrolase [Ignavibacteriaceae bacterium]